MAGATLIIQRLKGLSSSPSVHSSHDRTTLARRTSGEACPLAGHFIRERAQRARHSNRGLITLQGRSGGEKREKGNKKEKKRKRKRERKLTRSELRIIIYMESYLHVTGEGGELHSRGTREECKTMPTTRSAPSADSSECLTSGISPALPFRARDAQLEPGTWENSDF